jgi:hypothetical protein
VAAHLHLGVELGAVGVLGEQIQDDVLALQFRILSGRLPTRAAKLVREWAAEHQAELLEDWRRAVALEPLNRIPGADND